MAWFNYLIRNKSNGKIYIGKSNEPEIRWATHIKVAHGGKEQYPDDFFAIQGAIAKYGEANFTFDIIEQHITEREACEAEIFWIQHFRSWDRALGYNLTMGGDGCSPTEETRKKMSEAQQGEKHSQAILTDELVIEIMNRYINEDCSQVELAEEYGVHRITINDILRRRTWKHIEIAYIHPQKPKKNIARGERTGHTKLTEREVIEAIKMYNTGQYTYGEIAVMFNVNPATIGAIIRRTNWKHIDRSLYGNQ